MARLKLETKLVIANLLAEGWCVSDVARQVKMRPGSIQYQANLLVMDGRLERISERPAHYQISKPKSLQVGGSAITSAIKSSDITLQTCIYKKFGASFAQVGRPAIQYREDGKARIETPGYIVEFGRYKTKIWLKSFVGATLTEQYKNGEATLKRLGAHYSNKYGIILTFKRIYEEREVLVASVAESAKLAEGAGLSWGEQKPIKGSLHKAGDSSDPDNYQINQLPKGDPHKPEEHGKELEKLYSGEYERRFDILMQSNERFAKNLELHLAVLGNMERRLGELGEAIRKLRE